MKKDPPLLAGHVGANQFIPTISRPRQPVRFNPCPPPGVGVHSWILATANRCRNDGLSEGEAVRVITQRMTRRPSPANEVQSAVDKAYRGNNSVRHTPIRRNAQPGSRAPVPLSELRFNPARLAAIARQITSPKNWRHWLWERSPKRPDAMNAYSFLSHLYRLGETVLVFDKMDTSFPLRKVSIAQPMDCRVPDLVRNGGRHGCGIWFLCNPVSGEWHDTGERDENGEPILSCRNHRAITSWRYVVLESDKVPMNLWLSFVAQLPIRLSAVYTSGGRSVHALIRIDARSKEEWDSIIGPLKRPLKVLGADQGCLSAVRLTRLPQCRRPERNGFQTLLYLCPNPPLAPLFDLPVLFSRQEILDRWRGVCPRWNPQTESEA